MKKFLKIIGIIVLCIVLIICGLIVNNRVYYTIYSKADIDLNYLTDNEVETFASVFDYLSEHGDVIVDGFNELTELLTYNRKYEFLVTGDIYGNGWEFLGFNKRLNKNIYRRLADNPQAFAVKIEDHWVGSFCTQNYYPISFLEQVPVIVPPQLFSLDDIAYRSVFIHEMAHALQGNRNNDRLDKVSHLHNVNSNYFENSNFKASIKQEGQILEDAIKLTDKNEIVKKVNEFLYTRDLRRNEHNMTDVAIFNEKEFEWLEGFGRYAEFISSEGSKSAISRSLNKISAKVATYDDGTYYALGMAQIVLIGKLGIPEWQQNFFYGNYMPEDLLREYNSK